MDNILETFLPTDADAFPLTQSTTNNVASNTINPQKSDSICKHSLS